MVSFGCEKADELLLKHTEFAGSLTELPFDEAYWTDNELKAFEAEEYGMLPHVQYSQRDVYISHAYERGISHVT